MVDAQFIRLVSFLKILDKYFKITVQEFFLSKKFMYLNTQFK